MLLREHLRSFGFIFQTSEIYGGLANSWDLGPLAVSIVEEIKSIWKQLFVKQQGASLIDSKIILSPKVWEASGHLERFNDLLVEELETKQRFRVDKLLEEEAKLKDLPTEIEALQTLLEERLPTLAGRPARWGKIREFRLLFESEIGTLADRRNKVYLRPETAQGVFINFKNLIRSLRSNLPLTVAQIGRAFRNEITPAHLLFRGREFEQLEYESFIDPNQAEDTFNRHLELVKEFLAKLGLERNNLREREHGAKELAHYSKRTLDIEYNFPFGWGELLGIADRGSYDLTNHQKHSGQDMSFLTTDGSRFIPHIIETSIGVERLLLAILCDSFKLRSLDQKEGQKKPFFLAIKPRLAPYHLAILPLLTKHRPLAFELYNKLLKTGLRVTFDSSGSIGRRYRRQDAIATPFIATIDEQSLTDKDVTIRFRDSMEQAKERVGFNELEGYISKLIFD